MYEFISAAFPWVIMGIGVAVITAYWNQKDKKK